MPVAGGRLHIQRFLRIDGEDLAVLDLVLAEDDATRGMPARRVHAGDGERAVWVVSASDLRALKRLRDSGQDRSDLEAHDRAREGEA